MPCSYHPDQLRYFSKDKVFCPICENCLPASDHETNEFIINLKSRIKSILITISTEIKKFDPIRLFLELLCQRELVAEHLLSEPENKADYEAWFTYSYLIDCVFAQITSDRRESDLLLSFNEISNFVEFLIPIPTQLINLAKEFFQSFKEIYLLETKKGALFNIDGTFLILKNELNPLDFTPNFILKTILNYYDKPKNKILESLFETLKKDSSQWTRLIDRFNVEVHALVYSVLINKNMKNYYPERLFPELTTPNEVISLEKDIKKIFNSFTKEEALYYGKMRIEVITLKNEVHPNSLLILAERKNAHMTKIKPKILFKLDKNQYLCPFATLKIIYLSLFRFANRHITNHLGNVSGWKNEWHIHDALHLFDLKFTHPVTNIPLIGYKPKIFDKKEISDVIAYDSAYLFIIESKYWHSGMLNELEAEFGKFIPKIEFIKTHLEELGFNTNLQVIPLIVTPNVPFDNFEGIPIVRNSIDAQIFVGMYVETLYKPKPLLETNNLKLNDFRFSQTDKLYLIPLKISDEEFRKENMYKGSANLSENLYSIHDAIVKKINTEDNEIEVQSLLFSDTLSNTPVFLNQLYNVFPFDATKELIRKFQATKIYPGDLVRFLLKNLSGGWTQIQILDFKLLQRYDYRIKELEKRVAEDNASSMAEGQMILGRLQNYPAEYLIWKCVCGNTFSYVTHPNQLAILINKRLKSQVVCKTCKYQFKAFPIDPESLTFIK